MKLFLAALLFLSPGLCLAQAPAFNGKQLIDVTTVSAWDFASRPAGWYRIATVPAGGTVRGNATFELREDADHSTLRFEVGASFGGGNNGASLTVTSHSFWSAVTFPKLRILTAGVYDAEYLEVYVTPHNNDNQPFYAYLINPFADGDWTLAGWTAGGIPSGYSATEFNVDQLFTAGNLVNPNIFSIGRNGYVGIGTSIPQEALSVNGTIRSKQVKVEITNWPDYVFRKDYRLMPLALVKSYIDQNQHLPGLPTDKEVEKKGLDVGEMNKLLTKKVEELTLYLIEKDKELKEQKESIRKIEQYLKMELSAKK